MDGRLLVVVIGGKLSVTFLGMCLGMGGWWGWGARWRW